MEKRGQSGKEATDILIIMLVMIIISSLVGAGIFYWQNRQLEKAKREIKKELAQEKTISPTPTQVLTSPSPSLTEGLTPTESLADPYAGWLTYTNDIYSYQFKYPPEASIEEVTKEAFSLSPDEVAAGITFEEKFAEYTGKICLTIAYDLGYIQISAPENEGFAHVICGRTGRAYEGPDRSENLTIDGNAYTAEGFEEQGPGETLNFHNETLVVTLDDGTRIEYGSRPDETATFADYQAMRSQLLQIVESYQRI